MEVPRNSPLKPSGLAAAQKEFRLLFVTSTRRNAISTDIADYNSFVQGRAAAGHSSIRPFASQFRVVGSTGSVDARDNTSTTYTSSDKGVPIYWVRGNKVADEYEDFYDGGWDDERNVRDERGNGHSRLGPLRGGGIWTGSSNDGTAHASDPLGGSVPGSFAPVRQGRLGGSSPSSRTPLSHQTGSNTAVLGFYGLSPVFNLVDLVEVTGVSITSAPASGDTYAAAETVTVRLTFTEAVDVTGTPFVYLNVGGSLGKAVYGAGSGSANLNFSYTVQAVDFDANGMSICSSRLLDPACGRVQLDGGSIVAASDSARSILAYPAQADQSGHKVDGTPVTINPGLGPILRPGVPAMGIVPADWALRPSGVDAGDQFRLLFVTSTMRDATSSDIADYNSFVQNAAAAGHAAIRGYSAGFRALASTESVDARDNTATTGTGAPIYWLNSSSLADDNADLYDGSWANESQRTNERGTASNAAVVWSGSTDDGQESEARGCSGASTALGAAGCNDDGRLGSGVVEPAYNGNPLVGAALSHKSITLSLYGISQVLVWQVIHAKASSARIVSRPASGGTYRVGETVAVELGFGEDILVRGTPQLELVLDSGKVVARYASGSGTGTLRFEYVVRIGDHTARIEASLDEDGETALRLGGATITDARGETIDPGTPTLANNAPNQKVDGRRPVVTGVSMASSPASGDTYGTGETITVGLTMRTDVTVLLPGRPHVWLEVGGAVRRAEYSGPVGSATRTLEFSYTVQEGDIDTDGVRLCSSDRPGIDCGRIHLNGGTIRGAGGLDAELGTPNQGAQSGHKVDATEPIVTEPPPTACSAEIGVLPDWALVPSGVGHGGKFRLVFITSSDRGAGDRGTIGTYNTYVQGRANAGHSAIRPYKSGVRVLGSTAAVNARANTCTTGSGSDIKIYWLNGSKVADNYGDLYDGSWDDETNTKNEHGNAQSHHGAWTGTNNNGTTGSPLGSALITYGNLNTGQPFNAGRRDPFLIGSIYSLRMYGLSQVFTVRAPPTTAWSILSTPAADNTYRRGEAIEVAVDFSEPVAVLGEPVINFAFGDDASNLAGQVGVYLRGSGTSRLVFGYQVASGIRDTTGFQFSDRPIQLRGGAIRAVSDNFAAALTIPAWSALEPSQNIDGRLDALTGGICERTPQVRAALVTAVQENDDAVTNCSLVTAAHLAGITGVLRLGNQGIEALKAGDFAGLSGVTQLNLNANALSALPSGIFEGLDAVDTLTLRDNALGEGSLADRVFEPLTAVTTLALDQNPGFESFLPLADAGADLVLDAGETATLGGPSGGPWGTNAYYRWVEVDADGNEVAERTEGLAATDVARPVFTAPALAEERVLHYRLRVQGRGWSFRPSGGYDVFDTVTVTVRAAPAVTSVALTSAPQADATYRAGERIEVSVTFSAPVTVTGKPRIQLRLDTGGVQVAYARQTGPAVLVFSYLVTSVAMDADGVEVDADAILLRDGATITGVHGVTAMLDHDAVAADAAHKVDGSTPALTGGVCERTQQVRDALVTWAQGRNLPVTNCSEVTLAHLAEAGALSLEELGITALKAGDFEGLSALGFLTIGYNALSALPAGVFEGAESLHSLYLNHNALAEGGLPDGVFEPLKRMSELLLNSNPGTASFVPRADAGEDLVLRTGETATLGGPGTGGGPWGTNVDYEWVEVDAQGSPVAPADRTDGLSAADVAKPDFTAPALIEERVLRYRLTVIGKGAGTLDRFRASDTVTVTVRAAPVVTAVALTSAPQDQTFQEYSRGERIEVSVTFSQPVTVSGPLAMTPTIGLEVGTAARRAGYFTRSAANVLVFGYTVTREDMAADGIAVPADGIALEGGTITGSRGTAALLGHDALAVDTAHKVNGGQAGRIGGVCGRTEQVRDALVAKARASDCSQVNGNRLAAMTGTLQLGNMDIAALKPGDFEGLGGLTVVVLSGNALGALPERVLEPLTGLTALDLSLNPGSASFLPRSDAGADVIVSAGGTVTLGGPGTGRDPWGTNVDYRWVEVDADGNEVVVAARTEGLSGETAREAGFTAPALTEEQVLRYRLAVQGRGHNGTDAYSAADTVMVTVRAAPTVTAVALTSLPRADATYRRDERIEVGVTFSRPVTVTGVPRIGLEVGSETRQAFFVSNAGPAVLLFSYVVAADDTDDDGIAVPANGLRLAGGTIVDGYDAPAFLDHDAVAADAAHMVDGSAVVLTGGVCERTPQVRDALVVAAKVNDPDVENCSGVDATALAGITSMRLDSLGIAVLKPGDFAGLSGVTLLDLSHNALSALPAGVFDGLGAVTALSLTHNALGAGSIEDGVFEPLTGLTTLALSDNPGSASFVPKADAGADLVLRAGESATLGGPGTGGGPWGTNVEYAWVEVDAEGNPVVVAERTEGLSGETAREARFTAPALAAERVLRYRLAVQGHGHGRTDAYTASDTVTVTVRAAPAVTAVALTSAPRSSVTYRRDETIEVSVTFSAPVTVTGTPTMTPTVGLTVGTQPRRAAYARNATPEVLVFGYTVTDADTDDDGVAVPADGILLDGGTIADLHGGAAALGHDAVAADAAHQVNGMLDPLIGGVCERTPQVREALVAAALVNRAAATDCSLVTTDDLAGITGTLALNNRGIAALKPGDFAGLGGVGQVLLSTNGLSALPAGVFDGLGAVTILSLPSNALGAGSLEDGVFELLTRLFQLDLGSNPGSASFLPKADAGADLVLRAGESATLGGPGTGGGPWGTNVEYAWVEVDAEGNPVAETERTEGLSATDVARPGFTAPALAEERVLRYRFTVQGLGHGNTNSYTATDTVTVTVRAAPVVTAVALTSAPQNRILPIYRAGERIEVSVTFSAPVTVTGRPTIGLEVGTVTRQAAYLTKSATHVLVFGYTVTDADTDADGVAAPANGILLAGGTIVDAQGGAAALGHDAVAADAAHKVNGGMMALIGGVCDRTPEVREALVGHANANDPMVTHCSDVGDDELAGIAGALDLSDQGIAALKPGDFAGLGGMTGLDLSDNALTALPAGVFEPLAGLATLDLSGNPGSANFVPTADSGANLLLRADESATLGGPGTGGGPWGTNVDYAWVEVDADDNPVAGAERTEGLSATGVEKPRFTAPALAAERALRYRLTVTGKGAATTGAVNRHSASDTVTVTVRAAPAVTAVALTSAPRADATYREGETIEVSVTFSPPVTVTGTPTMTPTIGLEVGTEVRRAAYVRNAAPAVLVFGYTVIADEMDADGIAVPANAILLAGGTIVDVLGGPAFLGHGAVAADLAHRVNGSLTALTGGVCDRTPQVREALVAKAAATNCSLVTTDDLAGITGTLALNNRGIAALKPGDFAGLGGVGQVLLSTNGLSALPAGVFDGLGAVTILSLPSNALGAGSLEDGVFELLTRLFQLDLGSNPGSASFLPKADAGEDLVLRAGEAATLGGPGTGGGPWGTNVEYAWVEVDAEGNPVAETERTEGLSATDVASPVFTAPALTAERAVRYRFTVQGLGHGNTNAYTATDTITVTVRAAPAVTAVALTSAPQEDATYRSGETIEVSVTFSAPVTVTGPSAMTPTIGLEVGTETRPAAYARNATPATLVFGYTVMANEMDTDGVAVPADGILLAGGTIAGSHGAPLLGHDAVAADAAHRVNGSTAALTGEVCGRTPQVRDALVAKADVDNCSLVTATVLADLVGTLQLAGRGIVALKAGDFEDLDKLTGLDLSGNALTGLPAAVFDPLTSLTALHLNSNALAEGGLPDGVFEKLGMLTTLDLRQNPGSASFVPRADAGADVAVRARGMTTLGGPGTAGGPWGTNVEYIWVEVDAEGNEVAARTEGLSDEIEPKASFTAPVLTEERVLHYRLTVKGRGAATAGAVNRHRASATVQVTVRAGPALIGVAVTSEPQDYEIYGIGKEIEATASFGEAVTVTGAPVLALDLGGVRREATFDRMNGTAKLVFVYTVQEGDPEAGIGFPANPVSLPTGTGIVTVAEPQLAVRLGLAATPPVVRMDGVRPALDGMELPELLGLALKLIYHEALDEDSAPAAGAYTVTATSETVPANPTDLPVTAVGVKGNTVTLTLARTPGVSQMVTMTYNAPALNPVRDKAGNDAEGLTESQKVKSVPTVSVGAVYPKVAPGLGDAEFRVTVSQAPASDLAVTLSFEQADEYILETTATITIPAGRTSATRTFGIANDYTLASGALTATISGVGDGYATALAPGNAATVQVVVVNPPFIVKWDEDAYTVTEGEAVNATVTLRTAGGVPKPRNDYHVALISVGDSAQAGDDYPDVSLPLAVQPADWEADEAGFAASIPVSVATVNDSDVEADERFYLAVASSIGQLPLGLECPAGLRNVGGATSCSTAVTIEDDDFGVTGVTVSSTPQKASDTYGARENIEFAVAFNMPVTVTGAPTFSFFLGSTTKTATWYAGSGTDKLLFSYAVAGGTAGDLDTDGIFWLSGSLGNASGIVQAHGTAVPSLTYAYQGALTNHKVDGRTTPAATATVTVAVTSTPLLTASGSTTPDTYGRQETIEIEVTASEAVEVLGDPVFRFTIGTEVVRAAYDRMTSTATTLVFTYTVKAGDMAPDGIAIGDGSTSFELDSHERIRTVAHRIDIDRSHTAPGTLSGHKVDGSEIADNTLPAPDGATVFTNELTLTYNEPLDEGSVPAAGAYEVTATNGGVTTPLPVSAVAVDGSEVTLTLATPAVFGQVVTLTYTAPATNPLQDLFGNDAGALTNYEVTNDTIVLPVVSISAVHAKAAPWLADAQFRLTATPAPAADLVVTLTIDPGADYLSATKTVTIGASKTSVIETFPIAADYTLVGDLTATVTGGERKYLPATAPANAATVAVVMVNPPIVAQWAEDKYEVTEGEDATATLTLKTAAGVPKPRAAYKVKVFTTNHSAVAGDFTAVDVERTVGPGDWTADGAVFAVSVPVTVETVDDSLLESEERVRLQVSAVTGQAPLGFECPDGLENLGGMGRCATEIVIGDNEILSVAKVEVSSTPATTGGTTYLEGEAIKFTATFTAPVTVTGSPTFTFTLGEETREATYAGGSESLELVFSYIVQAGEIDSDGISWGANAFELNGGTIQQTIDDTKAAALEHPAQREALGAHRVDADPPGEPVSAIMQGTTLRLLYDEALDAASEPAATAYTLTADSMTSRPESVEVSGSTVTLTFETAPADGAEVTLTYTVPASNPVKDAGGNAAPGFTGLTVVRGPVVRSINPGDPPTTKPAVVDYTEEQLSSNVLGLKRWKLPEMKAHGRGATLTFKVPFDRPVTVTGAPTLKLDLWGETRTARYVGGSHTDTLTFTWGPVLTGDNDFDGIEVKELVLAGGATIRDTNNRDFVANSYGGEHLPQHKVFGGFHEMWIGLPEAEAVEGEAYEFSVKRSIEESRHRNDESHYVLLGITDSAFPEVPARGRYEESENGPGGRAVTFKPGEPEGSRSNSEDTPSVTPPVHEDTADGRTMTIALHTTHFTVRNEHGELAHRIYMPRNLEGVTVPVRVSVSGRRPATVTVSMASTPRLKSISTTPTADTYGRQETIEIAVTASAAVEVVGDPVFRFTIGADPVRAAYDRLNSTATRLLFTYTVLAGDMGADGISIGDGSTTFELDSNDRIRTVAQRIDIDRSHPAPGTLSGHKVDGSRIADGVPPALVAAPDGAKVFTDELTLTYDEPLDAGSAPAAGAYEVTATNGGVTTSLPVSAVAVDGSEVTLTLATPAVFGQVVTLTYTAPATNPLRDLFGNPAGALTNHPVTNETIVLPMVSISAVTVSSTPAAGETYLGGEAIGFTATFTASVTVTGAPTFAFTLGEAERQAAYASGPESAQLVFSYTVQAGEIDSDGISWEANALTLAGGTVRLTTTDPNVVEDAALAHPAQPMLAGHRVDADPPGVESASMQGTVLELLYDEALDSASEPAATAWTLTAGSAQSHPVSVEVSGSTVTLTFASAPAEGATVTLTYTAPATNPLRDLFGNPAGELDNHPVTNETIVLPVVSIAAVHPKAAPLLADAQFRLTASPAPAADLAVTLSIASDDVYLSGATRTVTIAAGQTSATGTFPIAVDYTLASGGLTATVTGGGRRYVPAAAPANAATVQVVVVDPPIIAQWAEDKYEVDEGEDATATLTLKTAAGVPKPRADYKVRVFTTDNTAVTGDDFTAVNVERTVRPGDWTADGAVFAASVPATVGTVDDGVLESEERFRLQVSAVTGQAPLGLECPAGLRDLGGAGRCATVIAIDETLSVTAVTVSSTPAAGVTYLEDETIEFTATFTAPVTVTGAPTFAFTLGSAVSQAAYARDSGTAELVFSYEVQAGEIDTDGISWGANAFELNGGTIRLTTTDPDVEEDAALAHPAQRALAGHRVDADPPGVESASMRETVLELFYDEALDAGSEPAATAWTLTAGSAQSRPASVEVSGSTVTLTFATAPADGATVTLAYTAPATNPVKDAVGNAAPGFTGLTVVRGPVVRSIDLGDPPTTKPAVDYGYDEAELLSHVLGLRRYKLHEMTAYGKGATLTFKVPFDRPVTVTGAPTLKLDLWGETRTARYVGGTGTDTLTFTWGPVLTGDNDFDGIEVKELVLAGGATIRDTNNRDFVANSYGREHLPDHKVFGGFHEMWIGLPEAEAVEGEAYEFSVKRSIEESRHRNDESHYVLLGITDSAFPEVPARGRYEEGENGPGGRAVTFRPGEPEGSRSNSEDTPSVTPPVHEDTAGGRTMTIALYATHFTVQNEAGELAHRIYMPRNPEGVTVPVLPIGTARAGGAPAIVGTPAVSAPQNNGAYAAEERIEAQVVFDTVVIVDETEGSPTLAIALAGTRHDAAYVSGSGSATLRFALEAPAGAEGAAAARAIANGLVLNGATVRDAQGNDAVLDFGASPRIASLAIGAAPGGDGTWDAGERVEVAVTFEEPVTVDTEAGTPTLRALVGASAYAIPYATGTGTDTLTFAITREDGAAPAPTVIVEGDSLALNEGTIRSTGGLEVDIAHPGAALAGFAGTELASIEASDAEAREGEALEFRLELSQESETPVSVDYETAEGTAHEGADYVPLAGTVRFAPGETVKMVAVATLDDGNAEPAETVTLRLSNVEGATLATPEASGTIEASTGADMFTGAFSGVPEEHDGTDEFTLTLTFDEEPQGLSYKTVSDDLFTTEGGTIGGARRASAGSNQAFILTVTPDGNEAVNLTLKAVPPCGQDKTVCSAGGSVLSGPLGVTVPGPAALSVADAQVQEGPGAVLEFVVSLDRVRHAPVSVDYATVNGEAVAGADYVHTAGKLTFSPGETRLTVPVTVLADEHDEESETLTLKLTSPVGARIADDEAVGTIRNNGAIPKVWIARFGRTVAEQMLAAVEGRMRAAPAPGVEVSLAGERIGGQAEPGSEAEREARRDAQRLTDWLNSETDDEEAQYRSRAVTPRDLLTGSSFTLTEETPDKDLVTFWGRGAVTSFDGREGDLTLDGEVATGMLGADWTRGRWTTGLILSHSAAEGGYSGAPDAGDGPGSGSGAGTGGRVEATLTGLFPWARHALSERLEAWGAAGYGTGELTVTPKKSGTDEDGAVIRTDLDLRMAAAGLRGVLLDPESGSGFQLTGKTDAMIVQTASGRGRSADGGNLAPARATVSRLRLGLEGSRPILFDGGAILTPSLEIGVRHDGGDAETGFGLDLGIGLALSDPGRGLEAELRGRGLLAHESKGFRDLGFSGTLAWEGKPESDRGAKLGLTQTVGGSSSGGADALLSRSTLDGLAANDPGSGAPGSGAGAGGNDDLMSRRLELRFGYGLPAFGGRFTWTPEAWVGLSDTGRDYSLGWRLVRGGSGDGGGSFEVSFEARRSESANDDTQPVHEVGLRFTARF